MARKTPVTIEKWVARAIRAQFGREAEDSGSVDVRTEYEHNAGDYEVVRAGFRDQAIDEDTKYLQTVDGRTIRFSVIESLGDGDYRLRARIE